MFLQASISVAQISLAIVFSTLAVVFATVAWRAFRSKSAIRFARQYARVRKAADAAAASATAKDVALGYIDVSGQAKANFAVQRAFVSTKTASIVARGRLSDEIIDTIK